MRSDTGVRIPGVTAQLAAFAAGLRYQSIPRDVRELARMFLLDFLGVTIAAAHFLERIGDRRLVRYVEATETKGRCTYLGSGARMSPSAAAFANATLGEVLDFGDSQMDVITHNGTPIIPVALAIGEDGDASWSRVAAAIITGYEVHSRLLAAVQSGHWYRGFQGHGTFGTCGAAVAAGKVLGFDAGRMEQALGVSSALMPVSASDNVFKAHTVKACIPGQAASSGIAAAELARAGFDGAPLEGEEPRFHAPLHNLSDGEPKLERALEGLGELWYSRRVSFKPYPVGHLIIGPVEIILELRRTGAIDWREIDRIEVITYQHAVFRTGKHASPSGGYIDAHFSIPYCVAIALIDGMLTPRQLWKDRVRDPSVHELASRIVVREDPEMTAAYPAKWPVEIAITLRNGESVRRRIDEVKWSPERPPRFDEIADKFRDCAAPAIGLAQAERAIAVVASMRPTDGLTALFASLKRRHARRKSR